MMDGLRALERELAGRSETPTAAVIDTQSVKTTESGGHSGLGQALKSSEQPFDLVPQFAEIPVVVSFDFWFVFGGMAGVIPKVPTRRQVSSPSQPRSIAGGAFATALPQLSGRARPSGASWVCPGTNSQPPSRGILLRRFWRVFTP